MLRLRHLMTHRPQAPDDDDVHDGDEIDELLGRANPNPNRVGCPPRDTLLALSRRARPIEDPGYEHLVKCSPCYREFSALQSQSVVESASGATERPATRVWMAAAAAVLLVTLTGVWWLTRGETGAPDSTVASGTSAVPVQAQLDLRNIPYESQLHIADGLRKAGAAVPARPVAAKSGKTDS